MSSLPKLGVIAGGGDLPLRLIDAARASGREVYVLPIKNQADYTLDESIPHDWVRLAAAGRIIELLHSQNVRDLVFAGRIKRPSLGALMPDARGARFFAKVAGKALGDDGLLRAVIAEFEAEGFHVVGAHELLSDLVMGEGQLGRIGPDEFARSDIALGIKVARAIGALDIGQAVIVQQGVILAVEGVEGTDGLIERSAALRREGARGVLVKAKKPGQERRVDLPTIGPQTVISAAEAGLGGVALEAGQALIMDRAGVIEAADRLGLFIVGFSAPLEERG